MIEVKASEIIDKITENELALDKEAWSKNISLKDLIQGPGSIQEKKKILNTVMATNALSGAAQGAIIGAPAGLVKGKINDKKEGKDSDHKKNALKGAVIGAGVLGALGAGTGLKKGRLLNKGWNNHVDAVKAINQLKEVKASELANTMFEKVANEKYLFRQAIAEMINDEIDKVAMETIPAEEYVEKMATEILNRFATNQEALQKEAGIREAWQDHKELKKRRKVAEKEYAEKVRKEYPIGNRIKDAFLPIAAGTLAGGGAGKILQNTERGLNSNLNYASLGSTLGTLAGGAISTHKLNKKFKPIDEEFGKKKYTDEDAKKLYDFYTKINHGFDGTSKGIKKAEKALIKKEKKK